MFHFPIVKKNDRPVATAGNRQLPDFYMGDFSVIGLRVSDCDHAARILEQHRFDLERSNGTIEVSVRKASRLHEVMQLLDNNGLECEIADVAEGMYQG